MNDPKPNPTTLGVSDAHQFPHGFRDELRRILPGMKPQTHSFKVNKNQVITCWKVAKQLGIKLRSKRIAHSYNPVQYRIWRKT